MQTSLGQLKARAKTTPFGVAWNITKGALVSHAAASSLLCDTTVTLEILHQELRYVQVEHISGLREGPKEQGSVGTAESERIAHGSAYIDLARGIRDVVQVTLGIGMLVVDGGRQHPMAER